MAYRQQEPKASKPIPDTHCQICARPIHANTGVIAHHGYQRPGDGWQTSSCFGARYKPYEEACDAIPSAIESCKVYIESTRRRIAKWIAEPPDTITVNRPYRTPVTVTRPVGFNSNSKPTSYSYGSQRYEYEFFETYLYAWKRDLKHAEEELVFLQERLKNWTPKGN